MSARWKRDWIEVAAEDVVEGDLYANGATVTAVIHGPATYDRDGWEGSVEEGQVALIFGEGSMLSTAGRPGRRIVVGRNARRVPTPDPTGDATGDAIAELAKLGWYGIAFYSRQRLWELTAVHPDALVDGLAPHERDESGFRVTGIAADGAELDVVSLVAVGEVTITEKPRPFEVGDEVVYDGGDETTYTVRSEPFDVEGVPKVAVTWVDGLGMLCALALSTERLRHAPKGEEGPEQEPSKPATEKVTPEEARAGNRTIGGVMVAAWNGPQPDHPTASLRSKYGYVALDDGTKVLADSDGMVEVDALTGDGE